MARLQSGFVGLLLLAGSAYRLNADSIFDFNSVPTGTPTTFSDTNNGLTVTFSSGNDPGATNAPGGFIVYNNPFVPVFGAQSNNLYENDMLAPYSAANPANGLTLKMIFSSPITAITIPFALNAPADSTLTLTAFLGGAQVGSLVSGGSVENPTGGFSYGTLTFDPGQSFDSLTLGNAFEFAVDNLATTNATTPIAGVPEPASTALVVFGLAGVLALIRRRQRKLAA